MKPGPFDLLQPTALAEGLALLAEEPDDTVVLAGGQSLVPLMNMRFVLASRVLDLNGISELAGIDQQNGTLVVRAMTRQRAAELSPLVRSTCPLLALAERQVGYVSIRHRGTVGGTIAHADTVAQVPCVAVALDAEIELQSLRGSRRLAASEFFVANLVNAREPDELVTSVQFPVRSAGALWGFAEFVRKTGDFPLVTAAVQLERDAGVCTSARIAVGGIAPTPIRLRECEDALSGCPLSGSVAAEIAAIATESVEPSEDPLVPSDYRRNLVGVVVRRALEQTRTNGQERT